MEISLKPLPEEILRLVLTFSAPSTIRCCQQVCRLLQHVIKSDVRMQYLLELDACGYVEPVNPRHDLTDAEKIDIVRSHRGRWNKLDSIKANAIHFSDVSAWEYTDGIFVRLSRRTRQLHFYQLPSRNRGVGYKYWVTPDLEVNIGDFGIDPGQDLLVLLEAQGTQGTYNIHIRSMTTGEIHSRAPAGNSVLSYQHSTFLLQSTSVSFEIAGRLLAAVFPSRHANSPSCVVLWNWTTGAEILRVDTIGGRYASFTMLSENSFVLPRFSPSRKAENRMRRSCFGLLDMYQFDAHSGAPTKPVCVASFALPPVKDRSIEASVRIRCVPTTVSPTPRTCSNALPKVFEVAHDNRLLYLELISEVQGNASTETLCVSSSLLLSALSAPQQRELRQPSAIVLWDDWAEKTIWFNTDGLDCRGEHFSFGQRMAGFKTDATYVWPKVFILDFDLNRLKSRGIFDVSAAGDIHSMSEGTPVSEGYRRARGRRYPSGDTRIAARYVEMAIALKERVDSLDKIMIDDEHVIIYKARPGLQQSLVVYTF
ncbi:hypothetical protein BDV93DRAFT_520688 [Ceratobasidium sp. AG-I]|nr:hypothetical protein BDV93DRAFT_520688 [Ceratobasidium sp. AG-I]